MIVEIVSLSEDCFPYRFVKLFKSCDTDGTVEAL